MQTVTMERDQAAPVAAPAGRSDASGTHTRRVWLWLVPILLLSMTATVAATLRTSTTFDELIMMAGGARGWETGRFDIQPEHPPLMLYLYGLPVYLSQPAYPPYAEAPRWRAEDGQPAVRDFGFRYGYSRSFLWESGNDPVRIAFLARLVGALCAAALVLLVFAFTLRIAGPVGAVVAGASVAFLPDMLAHGGVAYNDVPLALGWFGALWAADVAIRRPSIARGALFGLCAALALSVKFSAVVLAPAVLLLLLAEAVARGRDPQWWRGAATAAAAALVATYVVLVAVYRGDVALAEFRYGLEYTFGHVNRGHGAPAYLLGDLSRTGWWYFYPVAFLFKTPAALHLLLMVGLLGIVRRASDSLAPVSAPSRVRRVLERVRAALRSPLRMPVIGAAMFGAALLSASLAIGFRYALPVLPLLCAVVGAGCAALWTRAGRGLRVAIVALLLWHAGSALSFYPHFLAYTSEYGPGRDHGHRVLLDSSLDWGQGLLEVRDWMRNEGVDRIWLSYFGSGMPGGYGIDYEPLPSFMPLAPSAAQDAPEPRWIVVSATNLHGIYLPGDPMFRLRAFEPDTVLGHTMMVYRITE